MFDSTFSEAASGGGASAAVLERVVGWLQSLVVGTDSADSERFAGALPATDVDLVTDAERIDRIRQLERLKSVAAALQAVETAGFAASQAAGLTAREARKERVRRSISAQVALARRDHPTAGGRHVGVAKALIMEMPHTQQALAAGEISEWRATLMVRETATLSIEHRRAVDAELRGQLGALGDRQVAAAAARIGYRLDAEQAVKRTRRAEADRRVSIRPAPDTMGYVTALLPLVQGVAVFAALDQYATAVTAAGDPRGRGQLMADEFVNRLIRPAAASAASAGGRNRAPHGNESRCNQPDALGRPETAGASPATVELQEIVNEDAAGSTVQTSSSDSPSSDSPSSDSAGSDSPASDSPRTATSSGDTSCAADISSGDISSGDVSSDLKQGRPRSSAAGSGSDTEITDTSSTDGPGDLTPSPGTSSSGTSSTGTSSTDGLAKLPDGVGLEIQLIITDRTLFDDDPEPAILTGFGSIPAPVARQLIRGASKQTKIWVRRLYTDPISGNLAAADSRRRLFPLAARQFLISRDQVCRTSWCGAPIRHADHINAFSTGGSTTVGNGRGLCAACNYVKEAPGWTTESTPDGGILTTTPTRHHYLNTPPAPPRSEPWHVDVLSVVRQRLARLRKAA